MSKPDKEPKVKTSDPEVSALSRIQKILDGLDEQARARLVTYLSQRHGRVPVSVIHLPGPCRHPGLMPQAPPSVGAATPYDTDPSF